MAGRKAVLRVCASCDWIFKGGVYTVACPKCCFGSYEAKHVYGNKCYKYAKSQQPWIDGKVEKYTLKLKEEVKNEMEHR